MLTKEYIEAALRTERKFNGETFVPNMAMRQLHAAMGIVTEAGELLDAMKKHLIYGKELDLVNVAEELGDLHWYEAIMYDVCKLDPADVLHRNVQKLKARYPEKYEATKALVRNLEAERQVLEAEKPFRPELDITSTDWASWSRAAFAAREWAREFQRIAKEKGWRIEDLDEGLMIAWFANSIMAGWDAKARAAKKELEESSARVKDAEDKVQKWKLKYDKSQEEVAELRRKLKELENFSG